MAEVTPVPSASVIVLRDAPLEVLMIRRHEKASFVPSAWVFPGGMAEEDDYALSDGTTVGAMRVAGARELFEETGVWLGAPLADADAKRQRLLANELAFRELLAESPVDLSSRLVWTSHWITPVGVPKRFDTYFFLAKVPRDTEATVHADEAVEVVWIAPDEARTTLQMVFPTIRNLEALAGFTNADALIASRHGVEIRAIQPVIVNGKITLP